MSELQVFYGPASPEAVAQLEALLLALPQRDLLTQHCVHGGMCARSIFIPAGTALTGALTNIKNISVVWGDITVTTDEGPKRLTGFNVVPADAGLKRAGVAHADTYWVTIWPTDLLDVDKIEDEMSCESAMLQTRREAIEFERPTLLEVVEP